MRTTTFLKISTIGSLGGNLIIPPTITLDLVKYSLKTTLVIDFKGTIYPLMTFSILLEGLTEALPQNS